VKILWHSNAPFAATGYGAQTGLFVPRIAALGHDVAISCFYGVEGAMLDWRGHRLYPTDYTRFGRAMVPQYAKHWAEGQPLLVITLMDVWATGLGWRDLDVASWCPIDHWPVQPRTLQYFFRSGARAIAMSKYGLEELANSEIEALYVPHGVDTETFRRWPDGDRLEIREALGIPPSAFVVGMVANNKGDAPPRKAFPQVFQAFSELLKVKHDAFLYLHSEIHGMDKGINLLALAEVCGIPRERIGSTNQLAYHLGATEEQMAAMYSAFDVLANPSYGEGFGIPIVEAQSCGCPVIVTDWTAMTELCGAGWLVQGDPFYDPPHGAFYKCPSVAEIYDALLEAYDKAGGLADQAREFALQYDVERVTAEHWVPVMDELTKPREVAPLKLEAVAS